MTNLYVETRGDRRNPALVFLHGGGLSSREWQPQFEALSGSFYCAAPDLPEQGLSASVTPFSLSDAASRVIELIRQLPAGRADVIGLSLGGAVALEVTRTAPEHVSHLLVSGTSAGLGRWLGWLTMASAGLYRWLSPDMLLKQAYQQFRIPPVYQASLRDDLLKGFDPAFTRHFTRALMQLRLPEKANALVMVGERETVVAKRDAHKLVQQIQGARGVMVPAAGHVWNLEMTDLFSQTVQAFVTDAPLPAALKPFSR